MLQPVFKDEFCPRRTPLSTLTEWALPTHANGHGTIFGGTIFSWVDVAGVAAAQRYARAKVVTVSIDELFFIAPINIGDLVLLKGYVNYTGNTSMEVEVTVEIDHTIAGHFTKAAHAFLTYVAFDPNGKKMQVPKFIPRTSEEIEKFRLAERRRQLRMAQQ